MEQEEFVVTVAASRPERRLGLMKFSGSLGVDVANWGVTDATEVRMEREDNRVVFEDTQLQQEFGEGSEFGRAQREQARRLRYGRHASSYRHSNQPWLLSVSGKEARKYRGMREGGPGEHSDHWVFTKSSSSGKHFTATKVDDWFSFMPVAKHKTLGIDEAEQQFLVFVVSTRSPLYCTLALSRRAKVINQFALKAQIQQSADASADKSTAAAGESSSSKQTKGSLKISDRDDYDSYSEDEDEDNPPASKEESKSTAAATKKKRGGAKAAGGGKRKRTTRPDEDDVAPVESDEGDDDGREVDYMTDSGSESGGDGAPTETAAAEKALVGVGDESGLRDLILSGDDDSDDDTDAPDSAPQSADSSVAAGGSAAAADAANEKESDSGSDSDDPDRVNVHSAIFLQRRNMTADGASGTSSSNKKRAAGASGGGDEPSPKRVKESSDDGITADEVRRYLERKPHTTKELLAKFKPKCKGMTKADIVTRLAHVLKSIHPKQTKKKKGNKEILLFSLPMSQ